ncbi:hypothetical protein X747_14565 [Mesorhizobium sp. LNJC384A00]|uniref:hypothetical protein n=1 Tax=Mesorhizobium sp. LNJC384A00 TaxID=1287268 RepID=UPI0003CE86B5|nr:hypothetical protein [Mesorhizobium sp. LNJC384A00]ESY41890.1 hypothetical protein X747_14565 [Mesorhizobium sp. LNJC384A00]
MDGVLADFDQRAQMLCETDNIYRYEFKNGPKAFWAKLNSDPMFFANLQPTSDMEVLVEAALDTGLDIAVLTALPKRDAHDVASQKTQWVNEYVGPGIPVICCLTTEKPSYCKPGDILVDDRALNEDAWVAAGGVFIHHVSARRSVARLLELI